MTRVGCAGDELTRLALGSPVARAVGNPAFANGPGKAPSSHPPQSGRFPVRVSG
jgi:hypothetical protein